MKSRTLSPANFGNVSPSRLSRQHSCSQVCLKSTACQSRPDGLLKVRQFLEIRGGIEFPSSGTSDTQSKHAFPMSEEVALAANSRARVGGIMGSRPKDPRSVRSRTGSLLWSPGFGPRLGYVLDLAVGLPVQRFGAHLNGTSPLAVARICW